MFAAQTGKTENMKEKSDTPALMDFYRDDEIKEIFDISGGDLDRKGVEGTMKLMSALSPCKV